jgi:hypothetical protein
VVIDHPDTPILFEFGVVVLYDAGGCDVGRVDDVPDHWRNCMFPPVVEDGIENLVGSVHHFFGAGGDGFLMAGSTGVFQVIFKPGIF